MEDRFSQHTVLTYINEAGKTIEIVEGKIVGIKSKEVTYFGRVTFIDTGYLEVDCSKEYQQNVKQFKYKDIEDIYLVK